MEALRADFICMQLFILKICDMLILKQLLRTRKKNLKINLLSFFVKNMLCFYNKKITLLEEVQVALQFFFHLDVLHRGRKPSTLEFQK
jgi:hypothetical protein